MNIFLRGLKILLLILIFTSSAQNPVISDNHVSYTFHVNKKRELFTIALAGDIMLGSVYPDSSLLPANEGRYVLRYVQNYLSLADVACGNLEGVLADTGGVIKKLKYPDSAYYFKMPFSHAYLLKEAGFDFLSLANNHIYDFGNYGKDFTTKMLDSAGILYAGLPEMPWSIKIVDSVSYGFIAFAPNAGTLNLKNTDKAAALVKELAAIADIVIVSFHGGGEGKEYSNVTRETEFYMGENRGNVYEFTHKVIDAGADIVFGHGPHLTRAVELYNDRIIFYSLGNFCTYGRVNKLGQAGISPLPLVTVNNEGAFQYAEIIPLKQIGKGVPVYDINKQVVSSLQQLTSEDFPETNLLITNDGFITKKNFNLP